MDTGNTGNHTYIESKLKSSSFNLFSYTPGKTNSSLLEK